MKRVYILIVVFLVACVVFMEIYIHQVKGSSSFFDAPAISSTLWIIEWLAMLLAACITGMSIGWYLRDDAVAQLHEQIHYLEKGNQQLIAKARHFEELINQNQFKLTRAQESFREDFRSLSQEKEKAKETISSLQTEADKLKNESTQLQRKVSQLERELQFSRDSNVLLQINLDKSKTENENLNARQTKPFVMPPKDDLKLIAGIGPALEKKLNALGIYSYRQISEFTPQTINEIAAAIRFFPGRIQRDNWVSQARNFEAEKKRKA